MLDLSPSLNQEFEQHLRLMAMLLSRFGYKVQPYHHKSLPHFSKLDLAKQTQILQAVRAYCEALNDVCEMEDFDTADMAPFVWRFLLRLGITPSADLFETIKNEPFIQIYNADHLQIFRSLRCFERCSFTLEELTTRSWDELWERESLFYFALIGLGTMAMKIIKPTKLRLDFPHHVVREVNSERLFEFRYKIKSFSVLTKNRQVQAAVLVEDWQY